MDQLRTQKSSGSLDPELLSLPSQCDCRLRNKFGGLHGRVSVHHIVPINSSTVAFLNAMLHGDSHTAPYRRAVWSQLHTINLSGCSYSLMIGVAYPRIAPCSSLVKLRLSTILYTPIPWDEKWLERSIEVEIIRDTAKFVAEQMWHAIPVHLSFSSP